MYQDACGNSEFNICCFSDSVYCGRSGTFPAMSPSQYAPSATSDDRASLFSEARCTQGSDSESEGESLEQKESSSVESSQCAVGTTTPSRLAADRHHGNGTYCDSFGEKKFPQKFCIPGGDWSKCCSGQLTVILGSMDSQHLFFPIFKIFNSPHFFSSEQ